ncbi:hypothetical protein HHI36_010520 [Cryptolaemus montrouzieri]|uniref:Uncharacterized protein n=1 Tax=Cryptolaemus montrouzieri TaxID=559131 RepID=A0ABD2MJ48_9CUCU
METLLDQSRLSLYMNPILLHQWAQIACNATYSSGRLEVIFNSNDTYDLIIVEMFNTDCLLPINHKFNVPIIGMSSCVLLPWTYMRYGIPSNPSYIPNVFMNYPKVLNFGQRLENTVFTWICLLIFKGRNRNDDSIASRYLNGNISHISNYVENVSLMLVNTHFSLNYARPVPPNVIEVGGVHLVPKKKLPQVRKQNYFFE